MGEGKFIHSPKPGAEVRVESMGVSYWQSRFDGARRVATPGGAVHQETQPLRIEAQTLTLQTPAQLAAQQLLQWQQLEQFKR